MLMTNRPSIIPIYTSRGDVAAYLVYPQLYNRNGEWIGWVSSNRDVYSVLGFFVGTLSEDARILRKRVTGVLKPRITPPTPPQKMIPPATVPLPPLMKELTFSTVDVLLEEPHRLHTMDRGELREDMD
jgi:hypothetical protein